MVPTTPEWHFPDLCLLAIFKHLPVDYLFRPRVGLVCTQWYANRCIELYRRQTLTVGSEEPTYEVHWFRLNPYRHDMIDQVRGEDGRPLVQIMSAKQAAFDVTLFPGRILTRAFAESLVVTMPNITRLTVVLADLDRQSPDLVPNMVTCIENVIYLIEMYSNSLVDLKLHLFFYPDGTYVQHIRDNLVASLSNLFHSINGLRSLRHLKMYIEPCFGELPRLSILSRLATFGIFKSNISPVVWLKDSFNRFGSNLQAIDCHFFDLDDLLQLDPKLLPKFKSIRTRSFFVQNGPMPMVLAQLQSVCSQFISLTSLHISSFRYLPMIRLAQCLVPLRQLLNLEVSCESIVPVAEDAANLELPQVPSVRSLVLACFHKASHNNTEQLFVAQLYPNLEVMFFSTSSYSMHICLDCGLTRQTDRDQLERCRRLTWQPFRRCLNLHTFKTRSFDYEIISIPVNRM